MEVQARWQEMKWGGCFIVKKVENGECFFVKKWTFPERRVHYEQYQYFYFTFYLLGGGCVRTQRTPSAYGPEVKAENGCCKFAFLVHSDAESGVIV